MPNKIPVVFWNGSNYDYRFIIKELANDFEGQFECHSEGNEYVIEISYKMKFIDNAGIMVTSSSNLADNLAEGIQKIKRKDCCYCFL